MRKFVLPLALFSFAVAAHAAPVYTTSTTVPYNPLASENNFGTPGNSSDSTTYTVKTGADSTNFYVDVSAQPLATQDLGAVQFANIYVGGNTFSGLVFEVTNNRVFTYDDQNTAYSLSGTGYSVNKTTNDISFSIPFSFFESNTLNIPGFTAVNPGDVIRVSYSQSFGYSFVGGGTFYPTVNRMGGQVVPNAVPEPSSFALGSLGLLGLGALVYRRRQVTA